ncbi:YbaB/EbfC family nucleoid-associated protein [Candidatus Ruthia endofausta]|uniref:Nucleoid-associated protein HUE58_02000 n=1 Tax=Candidatus Ruthia endofausta TaxID=2738852 RepID=A0A6N0HNS1_9GAMM|nr:YbaB/EbfC family nucleoid-associated protein [Candidatus Ruthia endofausta]QKQ23963.1 YbaB/EbfC family nucleoid-associated protein [Candidatus Ruthia endofausta]
MFKGGMAGMMKKAQQMQDNMKKAQAEIKNLSATGKAAGNCVEITLNSEHIVSDIKILDEVMNDKELLEDLILRAMNGAVRQISDVSSAKMKTATGGMNLPSGMKNFLPF